jgi:hypothetical protein
VSEFSPGRRKQLIKYIIGFITTTFKILNNIGIGMGRGECQIIKKDVFRRLMVTMEDWLPERTLISSGE